MRRYYHNLSYSHYHTLLYIIGIILLFSSCTGKTKYNHYVHTPTSGWEKNDVLIYDVHPFEEGGMYDRQLNLRVTGNYPFMKLTLIVETWNKGTVKNDTVQCAIISNKGRALGYGIGDYQYSYSLPPCAYSEGDSLHIRVRHDMKCEILPGISDIGLEISKK